MIKFEIGTTTDEDVTSLEIKGSVKDLAVESLSMIMSIRAAIDEKSKDAGRLYALEVLDGITFAAMSSDERESMAAKRKEEQKKKLEELERNLDKLKDLMNLLKEVEDDEDIRSADFESEDDFMNWLHSDSEEDAE